MDIPICTEVSSIFIESQFLMLFMVVQARPQNEVISEAKKNCHRRSFITKAQMILHCIDFIQAWISENNLKLKLRLKSDILLKFCSNKGKFKLKFEIF